MPKYKIGATEAGDAGLDLSWAKKLDKVDGAVVITKIATDGFKDAVLLNQNKLVIHATITGYGGTVVEPKVPPAKDELLAIKDVVDAGFPANKVVIRIDPIIPTKKGLRTAQNVFETAMGMGFSRYRVSIIDMYPHVRDIFAANRLPCPYGPWFSPYKEQVDATDALLLNVQDTWRGLYPEREDELRIECCAEPGLTNAIHSGCVSAYDLALLGLDADDDTQNGWQRPNCLCYSGKKELLTKKKRCPNGCLYCYWGRGESGAKD